MHLAAAAQVTFLQGSSVQTTAEYKCKIGGASYILDNDRKVSSRI